MLGNFTLPLNTLPADTDAVRIRGESLIPPALKTYECFFNWAKLCPLTYTEIGNGLLVLEEKFRDESGESLLNWVGTCASSSGVLCIAKKLIQSFFNIEIGKFSQAEECLSEVKGMLILWSSPKDTEDDTLSRTRSIFCEDYLQGFRYILDGIQVFLQIQITATPTSPSSSGFYPITRRKESIRTSRISLDGLKNFQKLPPKAKYIVWTVRDVFLAHSFRANVDRQDWMENILELEPYIPKWHFYLFKALAGARKIVPRPAPLLQLGVDEGERIVTAASTSARDEGYQDQDDYLSISYRAMCLAQTFIEKWGTAADNSDQSVLEKIAQYTLLILNSDCLLDGVYLNFSEVYMFILPPKYRNLELAFRCLKKALRLNPTNTKTHYRMGLSHFKQKNHEEAIIHFREAIKNSNNIGAIFGLIQLLMSSPLENQVEIQTILHLSMKNPMLTKTWDKQCLRTLHYLKGCFHFMLNPDENSLNEETITSWIIAHDNESPKWSFYFHNLAHQSARFVWPTKRLNLTNVSKALKHAAYLERTQFRQLLLGICSEVDDAIIRQDHTGKFSSVN